MSKKNLTPAVTGFSGRLPSPSIRSGAAAVGRAARLRHPFQDYIAYLRRSRSEIERAYALEKAGGFHGHGTAASREFIRQRLAAGAQMLADLWYTAWLDSAGEPPAGFGMLPSGTTRGARPMSAVRSHSSGQSGGE